mgnify:CR=1 FL=1
MKKIHFSLLMLAIVVSCTSCIREPESVAFITSHVNVPITLYNDGKLQCLIILQTQLFSDNLNSCIVKKTH